ncbi:MAG: DUF1501 domain-containing protein, partial [Planctomycetaceae bacterium]|nr:DUF1501 domain-containing protein [Planctomycetaceae bacterium]
LDCLRADLRGPRRPTSLITLSLAGGPSQLETWDPHPGSRIGGPTKAIKTRQPDLKIAADYPRTAEVIHELSVIRSLVSLEGDHARGSYLVKTGYRPDQTLQHPSLGAILARERWDTSIEIPQHVTLGGGPAPSRGGFLGAQYDAFKIFDPGRRLSNLEPRVAPPRQSRRLEGLEFVTGIFRRGRKVATDRTQHQLTVTRALAMMNSTQLKAFRIDLDNESASTIAAYGDSPFGRGCLVARRLVQAGIRAIEVTLPGWDTHTNNFGGHQQQARILDPALAALVKDLKQHDLLDSTIVLVLGEFGRTPTVNPLDGRDHWPTGFSCLVGGGGLPAGRILGGTDPTGRKQQPTQPVSIADLFATILRRMGVEHDKEVMTPVGRPMAYCEGKPVPGLL